MADVKNQIFVDSKAYPLKELFADKFDVDFYQREYVWQTKQIEDLIIDLATEFLKNWKPDHTLNNVRNYAPYFMGEIVLSLKDGNRSSIIDGQQRITTFTLLLIYLLKTFGHLAEFPRSDVEKLIYSDDYGTPRFNLDIDERKECMFSLYKDGSFSLSDDDSVSVHNIVDRFNDMSNCWHQKIDNKNVIAFTYWIKEKVFFSKVWTNSDEFAYVIFETMNDRGLSLTQVEMLRSYLLSNIDTDEREKAMDEFDNVINTLMNVKLSSKSKAEFEFFKLYFRGHLAEDLSQSKNSNSDFIRIGKEFHRWVRDNSNSLGLKKSEDYLKFIFQINYFAKIYARINDLILSRNTKEYLYLIVNNDYGFTLQPALILAAIKYEDSDEVVINKIKVVSKYLTKVLSWRVWNHWMISQSSLEAPIYDLCKQIRNMSIDDLNNVFASNPITLPKLENSPTVNQQNRSRLKVLISLITEIVAKESDSPDYMLNKKDIEIEHIWSDHFEQHVDEFNVESDFSTMRNNIGDLLVLPKSFNASYGDLPFSKKVIQYFEQNVLAQSLNEKKYTNNPSFLRFIENSGLAFKSYQDFKRSAIVERAELYMNILIWNWKL